VRNLVSRRLLRAEDVGAIMDQNASRWDYLTAQDRR
jgi:hypothetical protein